MMIRTRGFNRVFTKSLVNPLIQTNIIINNNRNFFQSFKSKNTLDAKNNTLEVKNPLDVNYSGALNKKLENEATDYLQDLKLSELFSYMCIGLTTYNSTTLKLAIKLFPYIPLWMIKRLIYNIYCGGSTIEEVSQTGDRLVKRGINNMMISLTIEATEGNKNIDPIFICDQTIQSIEKILIPHTQKMITSENCNKIPPGYVALKPTGFASNASEVLKNYNTTHKQEFDDLVNKISNICNTIYQANIELSKKFPERIAPFVVGVIDAEKFDLQPGVYELQRRLYAKFNPIDKPVSIVGTLQMYLSNSSQMLSVEEKLANENNYKLGLKLVRGAYLHSEQDRKCILPTKDATDKNYNDSITYCIDQVLKNQTISHLVVASHNANSLNLSSQKLLGVENPNVVLGQLLGMADNITYNLIKNYKVNNIIKYVPWGPPLETKEYLLRRLEENGDAVRQDNGLPLVKAVLGVVWKRIWK